MGRREESFRRETYPCATVSLAQDQGLCDMKKSLVFVFLSAAFQSSAYNVGGLVGAWAPADDKSLSAVVVIEHHMAWALDGSCWRPFRLSDLDKNGDGVGALLIPFAASAEPAFSIKKIGTKDDRVVFEARSAIFECDKRKMMVRSKMPEWEKVCEVTNFVGTWKAETSSFAALIVRPDETAVLVPIMGTAADESGMERSREFEWKRDCAGIRLFPRENIALRRSVPAETCIMALRPNSISADIAFPPQFEGVVIRSAVKVVDPVEFRMKMAEFSSYHGAWVFDDRQKGYSFYINSKGRGILVSMRLGPEWILPFNWNVAGDGKVHCVLFPEFAAGAKCWFKEFDVVYWPLSNEIELIIPADAQSGESASSRAKLQFYNWNEMVDNVIEEARKSMGK